MLTEENKPLQDRGCINTTLLYILIAVSFLAGMWCSLVSEAIPELAGTEPKKGWLQIAALAVAAGMSIYKGIKQRKAAAELEKLNARPEYRVSEGTRNNLAIAKAAANEGLSAEVQNNYLNELNLGTASALRNNLLYGGGNTNTNSVVRAYNEGVNQLNAQDDAARRKNRQDLMQANEQLAEEERRAYQADMETFRDRSTMAAQLRSAGDENIAGGVGNALSTVASGTFNKVSTAPPTGAPIVASTNPVQAVPGITASARGLGYQTQQDYNNLVNKQLSTKFLQKPVENSDFWWGTSRGMFRNK